MLLDIAGPPAAALAMLALIFWCDEAIYRRKIRRYEAHQQNRPDP